MDLFEKFATDPALENSGVWQPIGEGVELLIARSGNRAYRKLMTKEFELNEVALQGDDEASEKIDEQVMCKVMSRTILLGWRTIKKDVYDPTIKFKGQDIEYSQEKAAELLAMKDFRVLVGNLSNKMEAYKAKKEKQQGEA